MFDAEFFPTPEAAIDFMLEGYDLSGMVVLEPSAGKGNIVDYLKLSGVKEVIACEKHEDLRKILSNKCRVVANDFFTLTSDKISHINAIIGNPPFSNADKHILHAWEIAPPGCRIIMLCNEQTLRNPFSESRIQLGTLIKEYGNSKDIGNCFSSAERNTDVYVSVVYLNKPGTNRDSEFEGFFLEDDDPELQANAIMSYNAVRDLVNRYVAAVKLFDQQTKVGIEMHDLISSFYRGENLAFTCVAKDQTVLHNDFKKQLQKDGWKWIFNKMNLEKYATKGLRENINKFVEQQQQIPFTMKNIYKMIEVVIGTTGNRMDQALEEMFDRLTTHYDENRFNVPGWKTNSHYLLGKKFIMPYMCPQEKWNKGGSRIDNTYGSYFDMMEDFVKALCYITGDNYHMIGSLGNYIRYRYIIYNYTDQTIDHISANEPWRKPQEIVDKLRAQGKQVELKIHDEPSYGDQFDWAYFKVRAYKKGSMHFEFLDENIWHKFNQHIARIKGYPLYEYKGQDKPKPEPEQVHVTTAIVPVVPSIVVKESKTEDAEAIMVEEISTEGQLFLF